MAEAAFIIYLCLCFIYVNGRRLRSKSVLVRNASYLTWHTGFRIRRVEARRRSAPERKGQPRVQFVCFYFKLSILKVSQGDRCTPWRKSGLIQSQNRVNLKVYRYLVSKVSVRSVQFATLRFLGAPKTSRKSGEFQFVHSRSNWFESKNRLSK